MLLDPFKEKFHLPTLAIEFSDHPRRQIELVRQQY